MQRAASAPAAQGGAPGSPGQTGLQVQPPGTTRALSHLERQQGRPCAAGAAFGDPQTRPWPAGALNKSGSKRPPKGRVCTCCTGGFQVHQDLVTLAPAQAAPGRTAPNGWPCGKAGPGPTSHRPETPREIGRSTPLLKEGHLAGQELGLAGQVLLTSERGVATLRDPHGGRTAGAGLWGDLHARARP